MTPLDGSSVQGILKNLFEIGGQVAHVPESAIDSGDKTLRSRRTRLGDHQQQNNEISHRVRVDQVTWYINTTA
jgi:hypothetical protein